MPPTPTRSARSARPPCSRRSPHGAIDGAIDDAELPARQRATLY
jgi:hypothetical protein